MRQARGASIVSVMQRLPCSATQHSPQSRHIKPCMRAPCMRAHMTLESPPSIACVAALQCVLSLQSSPAKHCCEISACSISCARSLGQELRESEVEFAGVRKPSSPSREMHAATSYAMIARNCARRPEALPEESRCWSASSRGRGEEGLRGDPRAFPTPYRN